MIVPEISASGQKANESEVVSGRLCARLARLHHEASKRADRCLRFRRGGDHAEIGSPCLRAQVGEHIAPLPALEELHVEVFGQDGGNLFVRMPLEVTDVPTNSVAMTGEDASLKSALRSVTQKD